MLFNEKDTNSIRHPTLVVFFSRSTLIYKFIKIVENVKIPVLNVSRDDLLIHLTSLINKEALRFLLEGYF